MPDDAGIELSRTNSSAMIFAAAKSSAIVERSREASSRSSSIAPELGSCSSSSTAPCPAQACSARFTAGFVVNGLQLEHGLGTIAAHDRNDQRNGTRGNRAVNHHLPLIQVARGHDRQTDDPAPALLTRIFFMQPGELCRHEDLSFAEHPS